MLRNYAARQAGKEFGIVRETTENAGRPRYRFDDYRDLFTNHQLNRRAK